jgi:hypothetical protein
MSSPLSAVTSAELAEALRELSGSIDDLDAVIRYCELAGKTQLAVVRALNRHVLARDRAKAFLSRYNETERDSVRIDEVEQAAVNVVRAHEKVIRSRHGSSTRNWNRVGRDKAIEALRDALRKKGVI